ncbi:hypothetical protein DMUE_5368 [Dictyocoela muelleri]|nr:hypothetical protein DMUE_5368 [Dictyocoela muelleri]
MIKSKILIVYGTFRSVPFQFSNLITINSIIFGRSFQIALILCRYKKEATYMRLFKFINEFSPCNPEYIITEFEKDLANSLKKIYHCANSYACLFHFGQACWRKIQDVGLAAEYKKILNCNHT